MSCDDVLIPCQHCNLPIPVQDYIAHENACVQQSDRTILDIPDDGGVYHLDITEAIHALRAFQESLGHEIVELNVQDIVWADDEEHPVEELSVMGLIAFSVQDGAGSKCRGLQNIASVLKEPSASTISKLCTEEVCPICQERLTLLCNSSTESCLCETLCGHIYCKECIVSWLSINTKCPVCAADFSKQEN